MQQAQLGLFFAAVIAWVVCGCIFTRRPTKKLPALRAPVSDEYQPMSDEHQPGCFALEEEKGGNWSGSRVPILKEARPTL